MTERAPDGKFVKGHAPNSPGRPPKAREEKYHEIMISAVSFENWEKIIRKAVDQALEGDRYARQWLSDNLIGKPIERHEISGSEGDSFTVKIIKGASMDEI